VETPEPPFTAAPGLAAALGLALIEGRTSWIAVVGGYYRAPFPATLGLAAELGFLLRVGVLCCAIQGRLDPNKSIHAGAMYRHLVRAL
jgi:hypothetical protein